MHIEILDDAKEDILSSTLFYEAQQDGVGDYFLDSISSDIESLHLYSGIHPIKFGYYTLLSKRFPYTIIGEMKRLLKSSLYLMIDKILRKLKTD